MDVGLYIAREILLDLQNYCVMIIRVEKSMIKSTLFIEVNVRYISLCLQY